MRSGSPARAWRSRPPSFARPPNEPEALWAAPGFAETFLFDGKPPESRATIRRNPKLAGTLSHLASSGLDDFYRGDVAREIAADLERIGMPR